MFSGLHYATSAGDRTCTCNLGLMMPLLPLLSYAGLAGSGIAPEFPAYETGDILLVHPAVISSILRNFLESVKIN